jgi:hypothetical protein
MGRRGRLKLETWQWVSEGAVRVESLADRDQAPKPTTMERLHAVCHRGPGDIQHLSSVIQGYKIIEI